MRVTLAMMSPVVFALGFLAGVRIADAWYRVLKAEPAAV
jgi:hypothetical protein